MLSLKGLKEMQRLFSAPSFIGHLKMTSAIFGVPRFKIVAALCRFEEGLTVTEIAEIMQAPISRISHQLAILRHAGLVRRRRRNREAIYALDKRQIARAHETLHSMFRWTGDR